MLSELYVGVRVFADGEEFFDPKTAADSPERVRQLARELEKESYSYAREYPVVRIAKFAEVKE